jgi:hypothetical protein
MGPKKDISMQSPSNEESKTSLMSRITSNEKATSKLKCDLAKMSKSLEDLQQTTGAFQKSVDGRLTEQESLGAKMLSILQRLDEKSKPAASTVQNETVLRKTPEERLSERKFNLETLRKRRAEEDITAKEEKKRRIVELLRSKEDKTPTARAVDQLVPIYLMVPATRYRDMRAFLHDTLLIPPGLIIGLSWEDNFTLEILAFNDSKEELLMTFHEADLKTREADDLDWSADMIRIRHKRHTEAALSGGTSLFKQWHKLMVGRLLGRMESSPSGNRRVTRIGNDTL